MHCVSHTAKGDSCLGWSYCFGQGSAGLIFHDLLHPMLGHFVYDSGKIENIAADAIINAVISTLYPAQSREGNVILQDPDVFAFVDKRRGLRL